MVLFTAGSAFWHKGTFEVFKKVSIQPSGGAIDVRLPPELEGSAYIQVSIHMTSPEDSISKLNAMLTVPQRLPTLVNSSNRWQTKLDAAQNVIYCKELFSQVCNSTINILYM